MDLTLDHRTLEEAHETRRYFAKFERIIHHLKGVADSVVNENTALASEIPILQQYLAALSGTFTALSYKYLLAGRVSDNDAVAAQHRPAGQRLSRLPGTAADGE